MRKPSLAALVAAVLVPAAAGAQTSNDPGFSKQYGPQQIGAPVAWTKTRGANVTIAIVDSGVDTEHPDLRAKLVSGTDIADNDNNPDDDSPLKDGAGQPVKGHGTHVAGIAAAITDNAVGIAGVAPDSRIMPVKVFPSRPGGTIVSAATTIPNGIRYAVDRGAKVINLSVGTFQGISLVGLIETPCFEAYQRGSLCVVASGNSGDNPSGYPDNLAALLVTANDRAGNHASFGQHADTQWAVSAPGVAIYATVPVEDGSYGEKQGTSMAAPHAAGAAGLLFAQGLTIQQVVDRLLSTAKGMGNTAVNGAGRIDAGAAVGATAPAAPGTGPTATTPSQGAAARQQGGGGGAASGSAARERSVPGGTGEAVSAPTGGGLAGVATVEDDDFDREGEDTSVAGEELAAGTPARADRVPGGLVVLTLLALAVLGVAWPLLSLSRRRAAAAPPASAGS